MKRVFIIIVNWKNWPDTIECIKSLRQIDYPDFQIVLVDNQSENKGDFEKQFPEVKLIANPINSGFSGGNNLGIDYALKNRADYLLLLNNDTVVDKDFLKILVKEAEENQEVGILGPAIYFFAQPEKTWFLGGSFNWLKTRWTKGRGHLGLDIPVKEKKQKVDFITGCCMLIKKELIDRIGNLDERFFLYYEDVDFCLRARKAGYDCLIVPNSKIWHKISSSVSKLGSPKVLRYHYRNALLLTEKNAPFLIRIFRHFWAGLIFLKQLLKLTILPEAREQSKAIIKGIDDYYKKKFGEII